MRNITNVTDVIFAALQTDGQPYIAVKNKMKCNLKQSLNRSPL
nr:hypothetical protein [Clostridium botulinum]